MIATPDYDATVSEIADPEPVLAELADALNHDPPRITDTLTPPDLEGDEA